ncbi:MAG: shikimate dehydrogenase [Actinobacteria bacterium]|nr:shikimate dehydrogenase [Actinomycetota bacterium]
MVGPAMTHRFRAAVLGSPIAHSRSPELHTACYALLGRSDCTYERIEVRAGQLASFLRGLDNTWMGVSLTMPLKEEGLSAVERVEPSSARIGAINTVAFLPVGVSGFNTDQIGVRESIRPYLPVGGAVVVVGTGATARSALGALVEFEPSQVTIVGRNLVKFWEMCERFPELPLTWLDWPESGSGPAATELAADVTISTLPNNVANPLTPLAGQLLIDVNYPNPANLQRWRAAGGEGVDGITLLIAQGVAQVSLMMNGLDLTAMWDELVDAATAAVRATL